MKYMLWILLLCATLGGFGQSAPLMIQGQTGNLYLVHKVLPKENWYSVGRLYNLGPRDIAEHNHLTIEQPLSIGQELKIPLLRANFSQDGQKEPDETFVPVHHILQPKEWIYRVSVNYNAVPVSYLEKWNNINKDQAKSGTSLIVGYLKVKTAQSALVSLAKEHQVTASNTSAATDPKVTEHVETAKADRKAVQVIDKPAPNLKTENKAAGQEATQVKDKNQGALTVKTPGGFFEAEYDEGSHSSSGLAGTFKSTSGWQDGKYYALMNNVPVGTIVKVTSSSTHKFIFAKILGQLPDMKESTGLAIRISNAASGELGEGEGKFNVDIKY